MECGGHVDRRPAQVRSTTDDAAAWWRRVAAWRRNAGMRVSLLRCCVPPTLLFAGRDTHLAGAPPLAILSQIRTSSTSPIYRMAEGAGGLACPFQELWMMSARSFLTVGSLIAVAAVMQANAPAEAQVAVFDPANYGALNLSRRQSAGDADDFINKSGGAFEPISA